MKQLLSKIFGGAGTNVAEGLSNIVDKFVHTKEKNKFEKEMTELLSHESEMKEYKKDGEQERVHGYQRM